MCRLTWFALLLSALNGCRSGEQRRLEAEVASLGQRIDALRAVPNEEKAAYLTALRGAACESKVACELKSLCVDAYTRHLAALDGVSKARALMSAPDGGRTAALAAAAELAGADLALAEAATLSERCAARQGELRRRTRAR